MNPKKLFVLIATLLILQTVYSQSPRAFGEAHVLRSLRQLHSAQATYQATAGNGNFGTLQALSQAGFIDNALASGSKYGYLYNVSAIASMPGQSAARFSISATPRAYRKSGTRSFYIDQNGELRGADTGGIPATITAPIIDDCTSGGILDNERCTILDMRTLHAVEVTFAATVGNGSYGLLDELYLAGLIRADLGNYVSRGYNYNVQTIGYVPDTQAATFKIWATPRTYGATAIRSFYIDQTGVLRGGDKNGGQANENDPPINK